MEFFSYFLGYSKYLFLAFLLIVFRQSKHKQPQKTLFISHLISEIVEIVEFSHSMSILVSIVFIGVQKSTDFVLTRIYFVHRLVNWILVTPERERKRDRGREIYTGYI